MELNKFKDFNKIDNYDKDQGLINKFIQNIKLGIQNYAWLNSRSYKTKIVRFKEEIQTKYIFNIIIVLQILKSCSEH